MVAADLADQLNLGPLSQRAGYAAAHATVGQQPESMFAQRWVAAVAFAVANVVNAQAVGQGAGADDLDAVAKHQNADGRTGEVVAVYQGIDQQFLEGHLWHLQDARRIEALVALHAAQVAFDEGQRFGVLGRQGAAEVLTVLVVAVGNTCTEEGHGLDRERRPPAQRVAAKQHKASQGQFAAITQTQVLQQRVQRQPGWGAVASIGAVVLGQVAAKSGLVNIGTRGASHWHYIGIHQAATLKHALHFFTSGYVAFVCALFNPDAALVVQIRLGQAIGHGHHHHQPGVSLHVFGDGVHGWAHMLAAGVAEHLIKVANVGSA